MFFVNKMQINKQFNIFTFYVFVLYNPCMYYVTYIYFLKILLTASRIGTYFEISANKS